MNQAANFSVDPQLATLLSENYRSTEQAIKELVDNAWDADAENVEITLPEPLQEQPIIVCDNGCGMTENELRQEYLVIAGDRIRRKGDRTPSKKRPVKGRKGIGKFAGLVAAEIMEVETKTRGRQTTLRIVKREVVRSGVDLEKVALPIAVSTCKADEHGTRVTLKNLNHNLEAPNALLLKRLLVLEYGREMDFAISVDGEVISHQDLAGEKHSVEIALPHAGKVRLNFTIMEKPTKNAGVVARVSGKVVGAPSFFGLEEDEEIPRKALNRVVGEIEADGLEADVTADWGAIIENSKSYRETKEWVNREIGKALKEAFSREVNLLKARKQKEINARLALMPEYRRQFAAAAADKVFRRFYGDSEEKIDTMVSLVLDAFEKDEYFLVCQKIDEAEQADVFKFAEALELFGMVEMAVMANQARRRLDFLDKLDALSSNQGTLEGQMHKVLERNLWVFGSEFSLMKSNKTLATTIESLGGKSSKGDGASRRPDLLLAQNVLGRYLLIEFKRPSAPVGRDAENQAKKYRDALAVVLGDKIDIIIVGGKVDTRMVGLNAQPDLRFLSYSAIISTARTQLEWLLTELKHEMPLCPTVASEEAS